MNKASLTVRSGPLQGQTLSIEAASLSVGRGADCGLKLEEYQHVSRHHARFEFDSKGLLIADQNSTNGVLVNGSRVARTYLKDLDRIDLGDFSATVHLELPSPQSPQKTARPSGISGRWQTLPGTPPQKWGAVLCALIVLSLGLVGMFPSRTSNVPGSDSQTAIPSGEIADAVAPADVRPLAPVEPAGGRISAAAIEGVKAATVLIAHRTGQGYAMGSGFALGDSRRIVTNRHVVVDENGQPQDCLVVFEAGTPRERKVSVAAQDIALAPDASGKEAFQDDLAVLVLREAHTPALPVGKSEDLTETDEVYAAGFPLGTQTLTLNGDLPSVSIKPARVERLQRDKNAAVTVIQLGSSVTHGNSGGPVVNNRGEVVGVISSGVEGTGMAYAIPMVFVRALP